MKRLWYALRRRLFPYPPLSPADLGFAPEPRSPEVGTVYFDAETRRVSVFDGEQWQRVT